MLMPYEIMHECKPKVKTHVILHEGIDPRFYVGACGKCDERIIKRIEDIKLELKLRSCKKLSTFAAELPQKAGKQRVKNNYSKFERKTSEVDF